VKEFGRTFVTFFQKKGIWVAMLFMLLYRLPEAFLVKMINPFFLDPVSAGGLGLSTEDVGLIYGTIGVIALTIGGIIGGVFASKYGLKKSLWPMSLSLALPCGVFVYLALTQTTSILPISVCVALDQFGYGFGFTAYMLYMIYFSEGEFKTAHYSICTAFMAMSMMIPGLVAGYLQEMLGYINYFWLVMVCCFATVLVTFIIKVDPEFGKKK
jgi:PAT family beta-lactamase induction signal transducer AmpG